jgi:hypothetical protein
MILDSDIVPIVLILIGAYMVYTNPDKFDKWF